MILKAENITKSFASEKVIDSFNLLLQRRERVALRGRSGVGKTSLLHVLAGLDKDYTGELNCYTEKVSMVFQEIGLFPYKTVRENIIYPARHIIDESIYQQWLHVCELEKYEALYPYQLSRGMKKRTAIIRGFIQQPELIFLDEPFSGLDDAMITKIIHHIDSGHKEAAIVIASHLQLPEQFCDRSIFLK